jgi:hypothetical protein
VGKHLVKFKEEVENIIKIYRRERVGSNWLRIVSSDEL